MDKNNFNINSQKTNDNYFVVLNNSLFFTTDLSRVFVFNLTGLSISLSEGHRLVRSIACKRNDLIVSLFCFGFIKKRKKNVRVFVFHWRVGGNDNTRYFNVKHCWMLRLRNFISFH